MRERKDFSMISIEESRCNQCGLCERICVRRILELADEGVRILGPSLCIFCGHCKAVCPTNALGFSNLDEKEFEDAPKIGELPEPSAFLHFLRRRRSLRIYKNKPVETEKFKMILEAGRFAPTGGNRQACEYVVLRGRKILGRVCTLTIKSLTEEGRRIKDALDRHRRLQEPLSETYITRQVYLPVWDRMAKKWEEGEDQLFYHAPALVVIQVKNEVTATPEVDSGMASIQMALMAEALGLGTCFIGFLVFSTENSSELREMLRIPADHKAYVAFTVGYPGVKFLRLVARNPARVKWVGDYSKG